MRRHYVLAIDPSKSEFNIHDSTFWNTKTTCTWDWYWHLLHVIGFIISWMLIHVIWIPSSWKVEALDVRYCNRLLFDHAMFMVMFMHIIVHSRMGWLSLGRDLAHMTDACIQLCNFTKKHWTRMRTGGQRCCGWIHLHSGRCQHRLVSIVLKPKCFTNA